MPAALDGANNSTQAVAARKQRYLDAYAVSGTMTQACALAELHHETIRQWRFNDDRFVLDLGAAEQQFADSLEELAFARIRSPQKGIGSDLLLITLLNAHKPSKYRPNVTVSDGHGAKLVDSITALVKESKRTADKERVIEHQPSGQSESGGRVLAQVMRTREQVAEEGVGLRTVEGEGVSTSPNPKSIKGIVVSDEIPSNVEGVSEQGRLI